MTDHICSFCRKSRAPEGLALKCGWIVGPHLSPTGYGYGPTTYTCAKAECRRARSEYNGWWTKYYMADPADLTVEGWRKFLSHGAPSTPEAVGTRSVALGDDGTKC